MRRLHEILKEIHQMETREERIEALRNIGGKEQAMVNDLLACQFNKWIQDSMALPDGELPEGMAKFFEGDKPPAELVRLHGKFANFIRLPGNRNLPQAKREHEFFNLLKTIHPKDAEIVMKVFTKQKWPYYRTIAGKVVSEAFPKLVEKPTWAK